MTSVNALLPSISTELDTAVSRVHTDFFLLIEREEIFSKKKTPQSSKLHRVDKSSVERA